MNLAATKAADSPGDVDANVNTDCGGSDHDDRGSIDGFDSDACPTPELSSPLRSATVSVRDLQVLTPSAKVNTGEGGGYSGGSTYKYDYDDDSDDDSDKCPTPELSSPLRSTGSAALCRRRLEEADGDGGRGGDESEMSGVAASSGPLDFVSEEEYARVSGGDVHSSWQGPLRVFHGLFQVPFSEPTGFGAREGGLSVTAGRGNGREHPLPLAW